jgi:hypothetical protein
VENAIWVHIREAEVHDRGSVNLFHILKYVCVKRWKEISKEDSW